MRLSLFFLLFAFTLRTAPAQTPKVKTGIEVLRAMNYNLLKGKRVGLITNPTGVDHRLVSSIDILASAPGVKLTALFGPEHGIRGDFAAGDRVASTTDARTGLPFHSLYGKTRKPTAEMLKGIDVLVYDIQDIGCRAYTYISTMGLAMEAAAENGITFVVLDRPNPLGGLKIEGNLVDQERTSFVSQFPIPYVYGLTCGELAGLLNGEKMLASGVQCRLQVVPMQGWTRRMTFDETGLPWVPTSPHVPVESSPQYSVGTGILGELGVISEGVGYTLPFRILAAEWIDPALCAEKMNALHLEGVLFRPITFKPFYGRDKDKQLGGVQIHITDYARLDLMSPQFYFMQVHHELYPNKNPFTLADPSRIAMFDNVAGSDQVRKLFSRRMKYEDVKGFLEKDVANFRRISERYYLYK